VADERAVADQAAADAAVAAASAALGRNLEGPAVVSGGSGRSMVLRCQDPAGGTVIVKSYPSSGEGPDSFAAEAAGLEVASGSGLSPDLLAADADRLVVVMADLGSAPSLADILLGGDAANASAAVLSWAQVCGALSAATTGRRDELPGLLSRYSAGAPGPPFTDTLAENVLRATDRAELLGVDAPAGIDADLVTVASSVRPARFSVFTPGDLCPDNNLVTADGVRLLDFEAAGIYPVFLDAAYIRMPFSTCWCVFRLPAELSQAAEACYRAAVAAAWPELADDAVWSAGIRRGVAAWTMNSMGWLLGRALRGDRPLDADRTSPRTRQLIRHRWQVLADELDGAGELQSLAALVRSLLAATDHWQADELPLYPAFRSGRPPR
jgi:hypothetical protein